MEGFDFFSKPVVNFNLQGKERVATKCGIFCSFLLISILTYAFTFSLIQISTFQRRRKSEKLEYGKGADRVVDFTEAAKNMAFRAVRLDSGEPVDNTLAMWVARVATQKVDVEYEN